MGARDTVRNFFAGVLVGAASWLPGISGGVVAVIFGVYERLVDDVSHLRTKLKEDLPFLVSILSGVAIGVIAVAFLLEKMMSEHLMAAMFFFVGLIIGQLPGLIKVTKKGEPVTVKHIAWLTVGLGLMACLFLLPEWDAGETISNSVAAVGILLAFLVGTIFAISKIVPGISASTLLLALGLFYWMNSTVLHFDLMYLLPFGLGFAVAALLFAKLMWHLIENHHHPLYYLILGLTVGSIFVILSTKEVAEAWDALGNVAAVIAFGALAAGLALSLAFGKMGKAFSSGRQ